MRSGTNHRRWHEKAFLGILFVVTSVSTFAILYLLDSVTLAGPAVLNLYHRSPAHAVMELPVGWRVRPNGIDKWHQCAVLIDAASVPRFRVCAFGYAQGSSEHPGKPDDGDTLARLRATSQRNADEIVVSDTRQTSVGSIYHVARTFRSSASYHVVESGTVVRHFFIKTAGSYLLQLIVDEDAAQRPALDPIAWDLAEQAHIH